MCGSKCLYMVSTPETSCHVGIKQVVPAFCSEVHAYILTLTASDPGHLLQLGYQHRVLGFILDLSG